MSKYPVGFCYMCGKFLYSDQPRDPNLICEILVCAECHQKTMETIKQAANMISNRQLIKEMDGRQVD